MSTSTMRASLPVVLMTAAIACAAPEHGHDDHHDHAEHEVVRGPAVLDAPDSPQPAEVSVAAFDRARTPVVAHNGVLPPVEARILVLAADGAESELAAIRSIFDHRGVPYDVFIATQEPPLDAGRLRTGDNGHYQATILTSSALALSGSSTLSAAEWAVLADYEATFRIRRAVLAAWPDPALGFGPAQQIIVSGGHGVACTTAGAAVFRDVNCPTAQELRGGTAYLTVPPSGAPLTPLLADGAGNALAVVHQGADGRESLLLLFRQSSTRLHSMLFLHGVLGWVTGGTYIGERRIDLGAQLDDTFLASNIWGGGTYRLNGADLAAALTWLEVRRSQPATPGFRVAHAFNGRGVEEGDPLTEAAQDQAAEWEWISHTYAHLVLDNMTYAQGLAAFQGNQQTASAVSLTGFDMRNIVTPNVSGLVNDDVMMAAYHAGIRYAVTDTSRAGCDNPSPNTAFYNVIEPGILLLPRRPTNLYYNVSTPAEWVGEYNHIYQAQLGASTYAGVLDRESEVLLKYLMRGDADTWMFHQANLRAYDGVHSLLGDLLDATLAKLAARSRVPVRTPPMQDNGRRFARRMAVDGSGLRATLFRGRALVIDVAGPAEVPVTGVRAADGEAYGGDVIAYVPATPGASACIPLDAAGQGCSPAPVRVGGPGTLAAPVMGYCNASSAMPQVDAGTIGDGGALPPDAGTTPPDAGTTTPDAGTTTPSPDAHHHEPPPGDSGGCATGSSRTSSTAGFLLLVGMLLTRRRRR